MNLDCHPIASGLFVGSAPPLGRVVARAGFQVLVLCASEHQPPAEAHPGVEVLRIGLEDDGSPMMRWHVREAFALADAVARRVRAGRACLVTCQQGRNRSGLVAALALARLTGAPGALAAEAVRARRLSPFGQALTNREFVGLLRSIPAKARSGAVTRGAAARAGLR